MQQPLYPVNATVNRLITLALFVMAIIYLAACFTPLHIHFDSIRYYNIKDCIEHGCAPESFASKDFLPIGYTGLLLTLSKLGILNGFAIVFVNCLYLFAGLYFIRKVFDKLVHPVLFMVIALLHWTVIKFSMHPLSEMQYIFFSGASLYCFHSYLQKKSYWHLAFAFLFAIATFLTRTIGISLLPALVLGIMWQHRQQLRRLIKKNSILLIIIILAGVALIYFGREKVMEYSSFLEGPLEKGLGNFIVDNAKHHFAELAELFINMPGNKLMSYLPASLGELAFILLGIVCFAWLMWSMFSSRARIPFYIRAYVLFYMFIIFNWPYYDPRFWLPLLPLMVIIIMRTPLSKPTWLKGVGRLYLGIYLLLGLLAAAYALYTGFDKERFARNQAAGEYRNEYEIHFFGKPLSDTATQVDQNVLEILNKYD